LCSADSVCSDEAKTSQQIISEPKTMKGGKVKDITWCIKNFICNVNIVNKNEPLDGDETEKIAARVNLELDINQGNITHDEFMLELKRQEEG